MISARSLRRLGSVTIVLGLVVIVMYWGTATALWGGVSVATGMLARWRAAQP